jgi:aspartyl-tRNA(Asn)/glutamyl-tRNA(Gln) amidotransferase subunit B
MTPDNVMTSLLVTADQKLSQKDASTLLHLDDGERLDYYLDVLSQLESLRESQLLDGQTRPVKSKPQLAGNW